MPAFTSRTSQWPSAAILVLAAVIVLRPSRAAAQTYEITDLGTLCDASSGFACFAPAASGLALDVNNWGRVVGTSPWVDGLDTAAQALPATAAWTAAMARSG